MSRHFNDGVSDFVLQPLPPSSFTRLRCDDFSPGEFEALGYFCAYTELPPSKVTSAVAKGILAGIYNVPHRKRKSPPHYIFPLRLAQQGLSMFKRYEMEDQTERAPLVRAEALRTVRGVVVEAADVLRLIGEIERAEELLRPFRSAE